MKSEKLRRYLVRYNTIILDLHSVRVKIVKEDQAIILLNSLPKVIEHVVDTMLYGNETITMTEVTYVLNSKEL